MCYDDPPWGNDGRTPSFDICSCCGVEFGYEDSTRGGIERFRRQWIDSGMKWFHSTEKPAGWNFDEQFGHVPPEYR